MVFNGMDLSWDKDMFLKKSSRGSKFKTFLNYWNLELSIALGRFYLPAGRCPDSYREAISFCATFQQHLFFAPWDSSFCWNDFVGGIAELRSTLLIEALQ